MARAQSLGRFLGTLAKFTATMTVGTRIGPRTVCTALSCGRIGRVIHSSQLTGRIVGAWSVEPSFAEPMEDRRGASSDSAGADHSISSAVATLVAIMQKAS